MTNNAYEQKYCLVCGGSNLINYLNLGDHPPANSYTATPQAKLETFPLRVNFCNDCHHSQLSHVVNPKLLFEDYLYVSGTTRTLDKHFSDYVSFVHDYVGEFSSVLEIGSNDGSLLSKFKGVRTIGVEPSPRMAKLAADKNVDTICDFWPCDVDNSKYDVIIANNVLAHNLDPLAFLDSCRLTLADKGRIFVEFPLFTNTVNILDIGQVYHEHINYFTVTSFCNLVKRSGLCIDGFKEFPDIHGGTVRFILKHDDQSALPDVVHNMCKNEKTLGLCDIAFYEKFSKAVMINMKNLLSCVTLQSLGFRYKIVGYGAAAKASTIINSLPGLLRPEYIVDNNSLKVGRYIPGTNIEIVDFDTLKGEEHLCIIIFPGNFKQEIKERLRTVLGKDNIIINITPFVNLEDLYD